MSREQAEQVARSIALKLLDAAPRSRLQLAQAMAKRDVPDDVAAAVLDRFEEVGLVNDTALAEMLVRTRHSERGLVGQALALELRRRGIDPETATAAMEQVSREDEAARARALAAKKLASTKQLAPEVRLRRTAGLLARKGYSPGLALSVTKELLAAEGAGEE